MPRSGSVDAGIEKPLSRKLARVQRCLVETEAALGSIAEDHDDIPFSESNTRGDP